MGRQSQRLEGTLPPILIEDFREERARSPRRPTVAATTVSVHPPGYEVVAWLATALATVKQDYERTIGTHREFHPRMQSRVEHRVEQHADDAITALSREHELQLS